MNSIKHTILFIVLFSTVQLSGSDQIPAPVQDHPILLKGGIVHTISGDILSNFDLLLVNGKILKIEKNIVPAPDMEVIRVGGKHIFPGFVAGISTIREDCPGIKPDCGVTFAVSTPLDRATGMSSESGLYATLARTFGLRLPVSA